MYDYIPEGIKPGMIQPVDTEQMIDILNQQKKCCCKIESKSTGTGFFCKIILPDSLKILPVLMTCNHVLDEFDIQKGKYINYSLDNNKIKYTILVDESRLVYTNPIIDFTIVQLRKNEYLDIDAFLNIEDEVFKGKPSKDFCEKSIYLFHYPKGDKSVFSSGMLLSISEDKGEINHNLGTESGSSGGPLINFKNNKLIGIHKGTKIGKNYNLGNFIKPVIEDFFKNNDVKKIIFQPDIDNTITNDKNNSDKDNNNKEFKTFKSLDLFVICFGIIKEICFLYFSSYFADNISDNISFNEFTIILFLLDIFIGILLKCVELFLGNKITLIISFIFIIIPFAPTKMMISSFFHIIPYIDDKIIKHLIKGEILGIIMYSPNFCLYESNKSIYIFRSLLLIVIYIISMYCIFFIIKNFYKFDELKLKEESNIIIKFDYFKRNFTLNFLILINFSITFSILPKFILVYTDKKYLYLFTLSDIIGRILGKKLYEDAFMPIIFFRFFIFLFTYANYDKNKLVINLIEIFILGLFSGLLTTLGYYILIRKTNKTEKISILNYIKFGKYYVLYKYIDDDITQQKLKYN